MKARIKTLGVIACALTPTPIVVARFRNGLEYVYVDFELRMALRDLMGRESVEHFEPWESIDYPAIVRGHRINCETGEVFEGSLGRRGTWINAEGCWLRTEYARRAIDYLVAWREKNTSSIGADNWRVLTAVRMLARAAGEGDPLTTSTELSAWSAP